MKSFSYVAVDRAGLRMQGTLSAASEPEARTQLASKGLLVEFVGEAGAVAAAAPTPSADPPADELGWSQTVAAKFEPEALLNLYRQIGAMLHAGVPLVTALTSISGGSYSPRIRSALGEMRDAVDRGEPISNVFEKRKDIFPSLHASVIRAAERGGFVDRALAQLSDYLSREIKVRNEWKRRTFYPKALLVLALVIILVANLIIKMISTSTGGPALYLTNILLNPWVGIPVLLVAGVIILFLRSARASYKAARLRDEIALWIPYYGSTAQIYAIAKFSRALALLFGGGVSIRESVFLAADASGNLVIAEKVKPLAAKLNEGGSIWDALQESGMFTPTALDMVKAGEFSGSLQSLLEHLAVHYEAEGEVRMSKFTTVMTLAVSIGVLLIVASSIIGFYLGYGVNLKSYIE
ncbi:MAG: type II secretion system F family protein [Armatimonadota bacterium]|nr:type II secretion system F family protein [Armatimonadota bacterium]